MNQLRQWMKFNELKSSGTSSEFYRYYLDNNLVMLFMASAFLLISECLLLILPAKAFDYHPILFRFVILDAVFIGVILILRQNYEKHSVFTLSLVQHLGILNILVLATGLNLASLNHVDYIHPVIIALTFLAIGFELKTTELIVYISGTVIINVIGILMLLADREHRLNLISNFLIFSLIAFICGIVVSRIRISDWLSQITVRKQNDMLEDLIKRDPMTRLFNHESILSHLRHQIQFRQQYTDPLCVLILDVDDFKKINDTYGHLKGDEVLLAIARSIKTSVRASDLVGRYGGEEFFLIFPHTNYQEAIQISERIRESIQTIGLPDNKRVTISGGLALVTEEDIDEIIRMADKRLYVAKHQGKNRIIVSD